MTERPRRSQFCLPSRRRQIRIKSPGHPRSPPRRTAPSPPRLTIDVTSELRGRIKVSGFQRGVTVADMLRELLVKALPDVDGGTP